MSRQDANAAFALTSFLYGGNAAYIEDLYARYETDPTSVDAEWQAFFAEPEGRPRPTSRKNAQRPVVAAAELAACRATAISSRRSTATGARSRRPSATRSRPRRRPTGVELSAADVQQATRDSIHALMLIRAYRIRGHFHANLDPLGLEPRKERGGARSALLRLHRRRPRPPDLPRQGARARIRDAARDPRHPAPHLLPDARRRVHAHLRPGAEGLDAGAHRRAATRRSASPARASARSSTSWSRPRASRNSAT